ncbi:MAG TPA: hypothetical protein VEH84_07095 [Alphaproteobacteria bacterium]|nr:hypothetical protein [Alphaproteobacteria bacterium]
MTRRYTREEAKEFIAALERQAREIIRISAMAEAQATKHSYDMYNEFRTKVSEFETFSIIIESRLRMLGTRHNDELQQQFEALSMLMLNHLIKTSIKFFFVLSASPSLPLGARDIFVEELRRIHMARERLNSPRFSSQLSDEMRHNLDLAEDILNEIIDKAPGLLNFGAPAAAAAS